MTYEEWKEDYGLVYEPNYCLGTEADCRAAFIAGAASRDEEIAELKRKDFREMREMLRAMQAGELTVSRGIEILNIWWAGNWNDSMLPPVRQDLIEENSMPVEIIDRLKQERDQLRNQVKMLQDALEMALFYQGGGTALAKALAREALAATEPKP